MTVTANCELGRWPRVAAREVLELGRCERLGLRKIDHGRGDSVFIGAGHGTDAQARGPRGSVGGVRLGSGSRRKKGVGPNSRWHKEAGWLRAAVGCSELGRPSRPKKEEGAGRAC